MEQQFSMEKIDRKDEMFAQRMLFWIRVFGATPLSKIFPVPQWVQTVEDFEFYLCSLAKPSQKIG